ncbi:MAG: alpha/beta hydrolase [Bacteroidota bacterium]
MKIIKWTLAVLLLGGLILLAFILIPRSYDVKAFQQRKGTEYWELQTGSKIGYTKVPASGAKRKSPILYLHGGPGGRISNNIIEAHRPLAALGHDLYFYDQIGSGHSDRLSDIGEYSVTRHRKDLQEIMSAITDDKVILLGQSWGACLAINCLQHNKDKIEKIILTGPGPILPINQAMRDELPPDSLELQEPAHSNQQANEKVYTWRDRLIYRWAHMFQSKLASDKEADNFFTYLSQELSKSTNCTAEAPKEYEGGVGYYSHIMTGKSLNEVEDRRSELQELDIPILILRGQCDNQKWGFTKEYLDLFDKAHLEIVQGAGHDIPSSKKQVYLGLIGSFLGE